VVSVYKDRRCHAGAWHDEVPNFVAYEATCQHPPDLTALIFDANRISEKHRECSQAFIRQIGIDTTLDSSTPPPAGGSAQNDMVSVFKRVGAARCCAKLGIAIAALLTILLSRHSACPFGEVYGVFPYNEESTG